MSNTSVLVVLSGGLDSSVLLTEAVRMNRQTSAVSFDYGQRHKKELHAAKRICENLGVPHTVVDLSALREVFGASSQTDPSVPVPHGHYAEVTMKATVVPNRNMVMLSVATALALSKKIHAVAFGAHGGDHTIYPDCRREFVEAMERAVNVCDWDRVRLEAPYLHLSKAEVVRRGFFFACQFDLTWSCYEGLDRHCGKCGTCVERREAFQRAGVVDPTVYRGD